VKLVRALLMRNADVNVNNGSALCIAVFNAHIDVIELLLEYGADPTLNNYRAMLIAMVNNRKDILRLLRMSMLLR
jgi:ankyrin repeat protein